MRILFAGLAASALIAGTALAHDHSQKKTNSEPATQTEPPKTHGSGTTYGSHSTYGSGTKGDEMKVKADDHAAHGTMSHGADGDHKPSSKTMPADGAVLETSPKMIGVDFGHTMTVESITVSTLTGEMMELDVSDIGESSHVMVRSPKLQADDYIVDWRARGADGHVMSGTFAFTVE